jgi:hypothetical protein
MYGYDYFEELDWGLLGMYAVIFILLIALVYSIYNGNNPDFYCTVIPQKDLSYEKAETCKNLEKLK